MGTPTPGPGKFSQRTDKAVSNANSSLPNASYGENSDYQDLKSAAPMASSGDIASTFSSLFGNPASSVVGLGEGSQMPNTPVTDGAALGSGSGPEALGNVQSSQTQYLAAYLPALEFIANQPGSSDSARNLVRYIKSQI